LDTDLDLEGSVKNWKGEARVEREGEGWSGVGLEAV